MNTLLLMCVDFVGVILSCVDISPLTPVIVGVGQVTDRPGPNATFARRPQPLDLMVSALEQASIDAGARRPLLDTIDEVIAIGSFTWHTNDPALLVAQRLGITDVTTRLTPTGGNLPQKLVHESARRISSGDVVTVAIVGSEAMGAYSLARKEGHEVDWLVQSDDVAKPPLVEEDRIPFTKDEYDQGLTLPVEVYPLFENARRARLGWSLDTQRQRLATLWGNFAQVAASNPFAWMSAPPSPEVIVTPSATNRMVAFPYTKFLVANLPVDMGAALIMTSYEHARALGVSRDLMIFPQCGADANDHWFVSERPQLDDSPAMRAIWDTLGGFGVDEQDLRFIDLYSCFPTVVQTACEVLGIDAFDATRVPTLTGGLTFAGGPGNNYVTHSIAAMVSALRESPDDSGLVSALGWFSTKHSWGTYAATPPAHGFQWRSAQREVDDQPRCTTSSADGPVTIETYTVSHDRSGEARQLIAAARTNDATRVWCHSNDVALMRRAESEEIIGLAGEVRAGLLSF